jgi:DNA polymerase-3 subunit epsilon
LRSGASSSSTTSRPAGHSTATSILAVGWESRRRAFLKDKPAFAAIADEFLEFIGDDAVLIAHNAEFDLAFLDAELVRCGRAAIGRERVVDTLMLARRKHPAGPNSLDALMARYSVDASRRVRHGALLDAELLSEVYVELIGGRQASLLLGEGETSVPTIAAPRRVAVAAVRSVPRAFVLGAEVVAAHRGAIARLGDKAIWLKYLEPAASEAATA